MGNLPASRITQVKPFSQSAVDFGGPFFITPSRHRGIKTVKAYLCVFVCFVTKAIHLELASDLSAQVFLAALQRFIARRGRVSTLHCDNATNFVSAAKQINLMREAAAHECVNFEFSPPGAPHFNGLVETCVKHAKKCLLKVIGEQILTYEEFYTILTLVESVLNSRPLTPISCDADDLNALTPCHFLTLEPVSALSVPDFSATPMNRLSRWQLLQRIHRDFWKRWHLEYLVTLQQREKWLKPENPPKIGTLVLIRDENAPPTAWKLGRIIALHSGDDAIPRVATVKTALGTLKRPLNKLSPLPTGNG